MSKNNTGIRTIPFVAWDDTTKTFSIGPEANELLSRLSNHHIGMYEIMNIQKFFFFPIVVMGHSLL